MLRAAEETCTVATGGGVLVVPYAAPFPRPRAERVAPGHLVALAAAPDGQEAVVWRWFDAVVLDVDAEGVRVWEPGHGEVVAQQRDADAAPVPGSRWYLSAGLPGAPWWLAGPAVARAEDAVVELGEVERFYATNGLWD